MNITEQHRRERAAFVKVAPALAQGFIDGKEPVALSQALVADNGLFESGFSLDHRTAYKWVQISEDEIDRRRRSLALGRLAVLWFASVALCVVLITWVLGLGSWSVGTRLAAAAIALVPLVGAILSMRGLRDRAVEAWLAEQQTDSSL